MSAIGAWVLSVSGIVFLGVLVDLIMPDGQMNKYIKGIYGLITLFVIVSPISSILNKDINFDNFILNNNATVIDKDFIIVTNKQTKKQLEISLKKILEEKGFLQVDVEIYCNLEEEQFLIEKVYINIKNMVINGNQPHINKYTEIKQIVIENLNVKESDVIIDG